jgi:PAS domain S-box-containing protein
MWFDRDDEMQTVTETLLAPTPDDELLAARVRIAALEKALEDATTTAAHCRSIVDDQTELICRYDEHFRLTFVNPAYATRYNMAPVEMIGVSFLGNIPPEDQEIAVKHVRSLTPEKPVAVSIHRSLLPDGTVQWHEWTDRALLNGDGNIIGYQAVGRDVTRQKYAEVALQDANSSLEQRVSERTIELENAKKSIEEERNLLRTLIDAVPNFIYIKDTQHRILVSNAAHTRSLRSANAGFQPGMADNEVFPPSLAQDYMRDDLLVLEYGESIIQQEEQTIGEQGEIIHALTTKLPIRNVQGEITGLVGYTQDITKAKADQAALQRKHQEELELQEHFKALHEISIELTGIDSMDAFYRRAVELGLERLKLDRLAIYRYESETNRALGTFGTDDKGKARNEAHITFVVQEDYTMAIAMRNPDRVYVEEGSQLTHDGAVVGHGWNAVVALRNHGHILGWLCVDNLISQKPMTHVTLEVLAQYGMFLASSIARKQAEQKLAALSQRLELATQAGQIGIWDWDIENSNLTWDDRMYAMYGANRAAQENPMDILVRTIHPEDLDAAIKVRDAAMAGERPYEVEFRLVHPSGSIRHIKANAIVLWDGSGKAIRMIGTNQDITELKVALEREKELGDLKSRFVSMASHEFRTPLATILSTTDNLLRYRTRMTDATLEEKLNGTREQALHMRDMMEDMLQLTRIQSGRIEFRPSLRDLDALCREIVTDLESQPIHVGRIRYTTTTTPLNCEFDRQLMRQVITNLITNGLKYSSVRKPVYVDLTLQQHTATLVVKDEGIGIPAEDLKHLFTPFHRAVNVENISGTGLGLAIAKQAIEEHGGTITVDTTLNVGSTFTICIPLTIKKFPKTGTQEALALAADAEPGMIW